MYIREKKESPFSLIFLFWIPQQLLEKNSMCHVNMYYHLLFVSKVLSDTAPVWWEIQSNCSLWSCMTLLFSTLVSLFHVEILVSGISAALLYIFWCPVYGGPIRKTNGAQCMSTSTVYRRAKWWFLSCFLAPFLEIANFLFTFWVLSCWKISDLFWSSAKLSILSLIGSSWTTCPAHVDKHIRRWMSNWLMVRHKEL